MGEMKGKAFLVKRSNPTKPERCFLTSREGLTSAKVEFSLPWIYIFRDIF
jgi:hypothetical protein